MKNLVLTGVLLAPLAVLFSGCGLGDGAQGSISAAIASPSTASTCLQLESGSSNQYCQITLTVQNNQTNSPLSIFTTTDPNNVSLTLPKVYAVDLGTCQTTMNNSSNIGTSHQCSASIQYTGGLESAAYSVYFMLCNGNCSSAGNPIAITTAPVQINSIN